MRCYNTDMNSDITAYNKAEDGERRKICDLLAAEIDKVYKDLPGAESKVWHRTAVWFLNGNPIVGYSPRKNDIQLLFWSGQSFDEPGLKPEGSFKAAEARYTETSQIDTAQLQGWLEKAQKIQWDYKNIVKRRGELVRL
jgi:hypothetical protein